MWNAKKSRRRTVDWVFSARQPSVAAGQELITGHLRRHAAPPGAVRLADRIVAQALASVIADDGLVWARLDWEKGQPILDIRTAPDRALPTRTEALPGGRVWALDEHVDDVRQMFSLGVAAQYALPVSRSREVDVDFDVPDEFRTVSPADFVGTVATTLVQEAGTGASMLEATTAAGASAAGAAWRAYSDGHGGAAPSNAAEIARAFVEYYNKSGGEFFIIEASERRAVVGNRKCPFGPAVVGQPSMCRATAALLGSLAARVGGKAEIALDEAIAVGDPRCRAVINLDPVGSQWAQRFEWPRPIVLDGPGRASKRGFRVSLSLQLPRDHISIALLRHLVRVLLAEVGAVDEDRRDVELAVSEAAANVVDHSGGEDTYEVAVTLGPELAELRVVDLGRGFDHANFSLEGALDDERGRGLLLINALVDNVGFDSAPEQGTVVHLVKRLHFDDTNPSRRMMLAALSEGSESYGAIG
jgi:anti-sigma regulatory factor (Ser/Thr protein kinase)